MLESLVAQNDLSEQQSYSTLFTHYILYEFECVYCSFALDDIVSEIERVHDCL